MRFLFVSLLLATATLLPSCSTGLLRKPLEKPLVPIQVTSRIADPRADLALDVDNAVGPVDIVVDPTLDFPQVEAETYRGEARIPTNPSTWAVGELTLDEGRPVLRVAARPPTGSSDVLWLKVRVPSSAGVRVRNSLGPITITGVLGSIDVESGTTDAPGGTVTVTSAGPVDAPVAIATTRGSITWNAVTGTAVAITARSVDATVEIRAPHDRVVGLARSMSTFSGTINAGRQPARLAATGPVTVVLRLPDPPQAARR